MLTPGHGQSRTNGSLSVPAGLQRPGENGSSDPCPAHTPVANPFYESQNPSREGGLSGRGRGPATSPDGGQDICLFLASWFCFYDRGRGGERSG